MTDDRDSGYVDNVHNQIRLLSTRSHQMDQISYLVS